MLGVGGWVQSANLIISGSMVVAAAVGLIRAMSPERGSRAAGLLLGVYGSALIGSGIFPSDPVDGFPDPGSTAEATASGLMHLSLGGVGFLALSAAAFVVAGWLSRRGDTGAGMRSRLAGGVILVGFLGGAVLSAGTAGVLLWIAVIASWAWLAITSIGMHRSVPHPHPIRRTAGV